MAKLFLCLLSVAIAYAAVARVKRQEEEEYTPEHAYHFANTDGIEGISSQEFDAYWHVAKFHSVLEMLEGYCEHGPIENADFEEYLKHLISSMEELSEIHNFPMPEHGFEQMPVDQMVSHLDANKNGHIDFSEFGVWADHMLTLTGHWLKQALAPFAVAPKEHFIGALEYADMLRDELNGMLA